MSEIIVPGIIIKGIGGFYYVKTADGVIECKAKGLFRHEGVVPLAGDRVNVRLGETNVIVAIDERINSFTRPPAANISRFVMVISSVEPPPSYVVIDKLSAIAVSKRAEPVIVLRKTDIDGCSELKRIYKLAGFMVIDCSRGKPLGIFRLKALLSEGINLLVGNSGVGKSSLLNDLIPDAKQQTCEISESLGRGKHTTRSVELFEYRHGFIADTPGFSSVDIEGAERLTAEQLPECFPEFLPYLGRCRFSDCSHTGELGCAVGEAVSLKKISTSRYANYIAFRKAAEKNERKN